MIKPVLFFSYLFLLVSCAQGSGADGNNPNPAATENTVNTPDGTVETGVQNNAPVDVALAFINGYVENCNKLKESVAVVEWVSANPLATARFKAQVKKQVEEAFRQDPELGLDADPLFDAQDYPDKGFELETYDSKTNYIVLKGKNWPEFKLSLKLVSENGQWLVDGCGNINIPLAQRNRG